MKTTRLLFISLFLFIRTFCWSQGTWTQRATLPGPPRIEAGSFEINGKGYVLCGRNPTTQVYYNDVWEYDPVADSWTQKANFPAAGRREPICFTFNGQGVVAMGRDLAGAFNDLWFYNASTDSWTQKANFPAGGRRDGMGFPIGNKIYMGSGQTVSGFTVTAQADWWEYNPATDTWLQKANLPGPIRVAGQCISDGVTGYIGMGRVTTGNTNDWWAYNAATDTWTQKANFGPGNRDETSAFILGTAPL